MKHQYLDFSLYFNVQNCAVRIPKLKHVDTITLIQDVLLTKKLLNLLLLQMKTKYTIVVQSSYQKVKISSFEQQNVLNCLYWLDFKISFLVVNFWTTYSWFQRNIFSFSNQICGKVYKLCPKFLSLFGRRGLAHQYFRSLPLFMLFIRHAFTVECKCGVDRTRTRQTRSIGDPVTVILIMERG